MSTPIYHPTPQSLLEAFLSAVGRKHNPSKIVVKEGQLLAFTVQKQRHISWAHVTQTQPFDPPAMREAIAHIASLMGISVSSLNRPSDVADAVARIAYVGEVYPHKGLTDGNRKQEQTALSAAIPHRAELFTRSIGPVDIHHVDIRSAFPMAALSPLPVSQLFPARRGEPASEGWRALHRIWVNDNMTGNAQVAALPWTTQKGVFFPDGRFEAWIWDVEHAAALRAGADVEVRQTYHCRTSSALARQMDKLIDIRARYPHLGAWSKQIANAAIGKIKSRGDFWEYAIRPKDLEGWTPVNVEAGLFVRRVAAKTRPAHYCPQAWGFIQASVRAKLLRRLMATPDPLLCFADMVLGVGWVDEDREGEGWTNKGVYEGALYAGRAAGTWSVLTQDRYVCRWQGLSRDLEPGEVKTVERWSGLESSLGHSGIRRYEITAPTMQELATEDRPIFGRRTQPGNPRTLPIKIGE
jgi:hypothetical protein